MYYMSESIKHFAYLTENINHVQHYLYFIDKETEALFKWFGQGHTNSLWNCQRSNQGLSESKALSNYYVWIVSLPTSK